MIARLLAGRHLLQHSQGLLAGRNTMALIANLGMTHVWQRSSCKAAGVQRSVGSWGPSQPSSHSPHVSANTAKAAAAAASSSRPVDYRIAVPSYDRVHTLQRCTLASLADNGIDLARKVDVFVATEQEAEKYARALSPGTYSSIQIGTLGIGKQRDLILEHFGAGSHVVMIDDDIQRFTHVYDEVPVDLHKVIVKGFELSHENGCYMWGLNNSSNKFYMRPTYSVGWCFFQGPFMAFRVRDEVRLHPGFHQVKEDVQYSLMHCELDGKNLRLNGVGLKAKPYKTEPGGLQSHYDAAERVMWGRVNYGYLSGRYNRFISAWKEDGPHPRMARSPQHMVRQLPAEELYRSGGQPHHH